MKPLLVVVGLRAEARIAAAADVRVAIGGGDRHRLAQAIDLAIHEGVCGIMSFGLAGGLAPALRPGAIVIARSILTADERVVADIAWSQSLAGALPGAVLADMAGVDRPVFKAVAKRDLHGTTGAVIADMESHIAGRAASRHGLPFASVRVVADPSHCDLPPAALIAMKPDGNIHLAAVLQSLLRYPGQLPAVIRITIHTAVAFGILHSARRNMGSFLADHLVRDGH